MPILNEKQNEFIRNATHRYNIKSGAVRSGKSFADICYVIPARLRAVKDEAGLNVIMGVSKETVERNVLQPMREIYTSDIVGTINSRNIAMVCGVPVYCLGAEKASQVAKIQGSSIKYCYGDEIARWSPNVFDMLKSRLDKPYSKFDGSCNPESPSHWLKQFIDSEDIDIYVQKYTIFDNPALSKEFVDNLCKEYEGTVYYNRLILGEWTLAEGLIYPMYKDAIQEPPKDESGNIKPAEQYVLSVDYGTLNAFAALLWGRYGDVWYAIDGYYYSGRDTGTLLTDEEYGQAIDDKFGQYTSEYARLPVIIDPSAASFITLLKRKMRYKVIQADNSVLDGIRETATAMKIGKIKISPNLKDWIREAEGYVWDDSCVEDRPLKLNDHCLTGDTLVMTENGEKPISELVGTTGKVWSYNTFTDEKELRQYKDCRLTQKQVPVWELKTASGKTIKGTIDHLILTKSGWLELGKCMFEYIQMIDGSFEEVVYIHAVGYADVYNMEVADNHNFAVNDGLIVHNCMDSTRYFVKTMRLLKPQTNYTPLFTLA